MKPITIDPNSRFNQFLVWWYGSRIKWHDIDFCQYSRKIFWVVLWMTVLFTFVTTLGVGIGYGFLTKSQTFLTFDTYWQLLLASLILGLFFEAFVIGVAYGAVIGLANLIEKLSGWANRRAYKRYLAQRDAVEEEPKEPHIVVMWAQAISRKICVPIKIKE